jgi:superfamily II DNA or RNA helicase
MTTVMGAEGLDLKNVRSIHITEPYWQPVLIEQVIGRGVRNNSHIRLRPDERNVDVFIYMASIPSNLVAKITHANVRSDYAKYNDGLGMRGKIVSSDEALFVISEHKKDITKQLTHIMKEAAFDCTLNYAVNSQQHKDIVCLDYDTANRDDYLFTASLEGTKDLIDINQEVAIVEDYTEQIFFNIKYFVSNTPTPDGKYLIYPESIAKTTRKPDAVGAMIIKDGKKLWSFTKEEKAKWH